MQKLLLLGAPITLVAFVFGLVFAEEGPKIPKAEGVVKSVDAVAASITLEGRKKEGKQVDPDKTLPLAPGAKVTIDGEAKTLDEVKPGARALLVLTADGDKITEVAIRTTKPERKEGEGEGRNPRLTKLTGLVGSIGSGELVVVQRGDSGERKTTLVVGSKVTVQRESDENMSVTGEGGKTREVPKIVEAKLSDVQAGQEISVSSNASNEVISVLILRPAKKEKGEGDR